MKTIILAALLLAPSLTNAASLTFDPETQRVEIADNGALSIGGQYIFQFKYGNRNQISDLYAAITSAKAKKSMVEIEYGFDSMSGNKIKFYSIKYPKHENDELSRCQIEKEVLSETLQQFMLNQNNDYNRDEIREIMQSIDTERDDTAAISE